MLLHELAVKLFDAGAIQLGDIEAKTGRRTPIYFDFRVAVSYPDIMRAVAEQLQKLASKIHYDLLCGVPYAALPLAAVMSVYSNTPMIMKRKETKLYGTRKILEGVFKKGQTCLVIEDVVTSGASLLETVGTLRNKGLIILNALVVLDRSQGGVSVLKQNGVDVLPLFTLTDFVEILINAGRIDEQTVVIIKDHIRKCQFDNLNNLANT